MCLVWFSDLVRGRTPRQMDATNLALAGLSAGVGGMTGAFLSSMIYSGGRELVAAPTETMISQAVSYIRKPTKEKAAKLTQGLTGGNIWYFDRAFRGLVHENLWGSPFTKNERRYMKKIGQKPITLDGRGF